ncbi:MAG: site-2 protease family protein [bacterium]|nr:site-2 protease family protein [bacterium]
MQVATILGIPIRIHYSFLLLLVWYGWERSRGGDNPALAVALLLLIFTCVALHELGHAAMAKLFGVRTREIVLYPIGGIARLENLPAGRAELFIALAGPAVNVVIAVAMFFVLFFTRAQPALGQLSHPADLLWNLFFVNIALFAFNLLPAFPMDGGRILRAGLALATSQERATEIAAVVGRGLAVLLFVAGALTLPSGVLLMVVALFVFIGASQEAYFYRQRAAVRGQTARAAMITRFETLAPQDSLGEAAEQLLATHQQDFPVLDAWQRLVGVLARATLLEGLARLGSAAAVLEVMDRNVAWVHPDDNLDRVLEHLRARPRTPVAVVDDGRLLGMITFDNLAEFMEVSRRAGPIGRA